MKHSNHPKVSLLKCVLLIILLIISVVNASAQISFEIASDVTGSGLGGNFCPSIALSHNKSDFSIGANFQRKKFNLSGIQANYRYTVCGGAFEKVELFFCGNLTVHGSAYLSKGLVKIEQSNQSEMAFKYDALTFKVIESYLGFGLKINHTKKISTVFNTGFGGFGTISKNYDRKMCREKAAPALQLRVALVYNFGNKN